jgi:hypothetical protein
MSRIFDVLFGCSHRRVTLPYGNHQCCLDCGAARSYIIGEKPGEWTKERPSREVAA